MAMPDDDGWIRDLASSLDALVRDIEPPRSAAARSRRPGSATPKIASPKIAAPKIAGPKIAAMSDPRGEADRAAPAPAWPPAVQAEIDAFRVLVAHGAPRPR